MILIGSLAKISHTISTILARSKKKRRSEAPGALARLCTGLWVTWSRWIRVPEARSLTIFFINPSFLFPKTLAIHLNNPSPLLYVVLSYYQRVAGCRLIAVLAASREV